MGPGGDRREVEEGDGDPPLNVASYSKLTPLL